MITLMCEFFCSFLLVIAVFMSYIVNVYTEHAKSRALAFCSCFVGKNSFCAPLFRNIRVNSIEFMQSIGLQMKI